MKRILLVLLLLLFSFLCFSQPGFNCDDPDLADESCFIETGPLDSGVSFLMIAGVIFSIVYLRKGE